MPTRECDRCEETRADVCAACLRCPMCQDWDCAACLLDADREIAYPLPTPPRFQVGDPVWAPNGEPRVVTGRRWGQVQAVHGERQRWQPWGWVLDTVHPDDPECKGRGFEPHYRLREVSLAPSPS